MSELECPYCGNDCETPDDCHSEDETYEWQCSKCEKNFVFTLYYSVSYTAYEAPCLNGAEHQWKDIHGSPEEYFRGKQRCEFCEKQRTVKEPTK